MCQKIVYTYYRWYIILVFIIVCIFFSLGSFLLYSIYNDSSATDLFWFGGGMFATVFIVSVLYLTEIISYRLVLDHDVILEWRKTLPFGKSKLRFTFIHQHTDDSSATTNVDLRHGKIQPALHISIFCNGFAPVKHRLAERDHLIAHYVGRTDCPTVPSFSAFRRHQLHCIALLWIVPSILAYIVLFQLHVHPVVNFSAYLLFVFIISYFWYNFSKLPKTYLSDTLELVRNPIPYVLVFLTALLGYSVLLKFSISNAIPLAVVSFILTFILHWRYRRLLHSTAYYITFFCLPVVLFNMLVIINFIPTGKPTESVQVPVYAKHHTDSFPPFFTVDVDIWEDGEPTGFDLKNSVYDQVEVGDTLSFTIHRGLLGIRWIKNPSTIDDLLIRKTKP